MADFNSSLPVRTQNNGDVVVNISDGTTESQKLAVDSSGRITTKMDDGAGNAITSQANGSQRALDVGIDVAGVQIDPRSIRALTSSDVVTVDQGTANTAANAWPTYLTTGGTANSPTNPIFVSSSDIIGTAVDNYQTSTSLAAAGSVTLTYTVTAGKTFYSKQFWVSGSGKIKAVIQYAATTFWVGFNSTANTNIIVPVPSGKTAAATTTVSVTITNEDLSAFDVYCTISGVEQ